LGSRLQNSQNARICSKQNFSDLVDFQKIRTLKPLIVFGRVNICRKDEDVICNVSIESFPSFYLF
jgi:hypothetical protein